MPLHVGIDRERSLETGECDLRCVIYSLEASHFYHHLDHLLSIANFEFPLLTKGGLRLDVLLNATTQEREYTRLIDSVNAPIFGVDNFGKVTIWNKNAQKLVGYPSVEVMGRNLVEHFITPEHRARVQSVIDQALEGEETGVLMCEPYATLSIVLNFTYNSLNPWYATPSEF